jgi:hypothetical protein
MAVGIPARIREGRVTETLVAGNVEAYLRHVVQHREGSRPIALEDCIEVQ